MQTARTCVGGLNSYSSDCDPGFQETEVDGEKVCGGNIHDCGDVGCGEVRDVRGFGRWLLVLVCRWVQADHARSRFNLRGKIRWELRHHELS